MSRDIKLVCSRTNFHTNTIPTTFIQRNEVVVKFGTEETYTVNSQISRNSPVWEIGVCVRVLFINWESWECHHNSIFVREQH